MPDSSHGGAIGVGSVSTPDTPQRPSGAMWDRLAACRTAAELRAFAEDASRRGAAPSGQLMTAILDRLAAHPD